MPKYKILGQYEQGNYFYGHLKIAVFGRKALIIFPIWIKSGGNFLSQILIYMKNTV